MPPTRRTLSRRSDLYRLAADAALEQAIATGSEKLLEKAARLLAAACTTADLASGSDVGRALFGLALLAPPAERRAA